MEDEQADLHPKHAAEIFLRFSVDAEKISRKGRSQFNKT
jgi:hypothetical protein